VTRRSRRISLAFAALLLLFGGAVWWLMASEPGLRFVWERVRTWSPVPLAGEVHGRLIGPLRVDGFRMDLKRARVEAASADLDWSPWGLWQGRLLFSRSEVRDLVIEVRPATPGAATTPPRIPTSPLLIDVQNGRVEGLTVRPVPGSDAFHPVHFERVGIDAVAGPHRLTVRAASLDGYGAHLETDGEIELRLDGAVALATRWNWQLPEGERLRGHGTLTGTVLRPRSDQSLDQGMEGTARGALVWLDRPIAWEAEVIARPVNVARLDRRLRPLVVSGTARGEGGSGRLHVTAKGRAADAAWGEWSFDGEGSRERDGWRLPFVNLGAVDGPAKVAASGFLNTTGATSVEAELQWSGFPVAADAVAVSPAGQVTVHGSLDGYRVAGTARLARPGLPDGEVDLEGKGDRTAFEVETLRAAWLDGEVTGAGRVQWSPRLAWSAELRSRDLNPGRWRADFPGRVSARLVSKGERRKEGLRAELSLEEVGGELRGKPLSGHGRFQWEGERLRIDALDLVNGTAALSAEGELGARWDLRAALEAEQIGDLVPGVAGRVQVEARVSGPRAKPWLRTEASGEQLVWGERRAGRFAIKGSIDLAGDNPWDARILGEDLHFGALALEKLDLTGQGDPANHHLVLDAGAEGRLFHLEARGGYQAPRWQGEISAGRVEDPKLGVWSQAAPVALAVDPRSVRLDRICWSHEGASLCTAVSGGMGREWRGEAALRAFPVAALQPFLQEGFEVDGLLEGHAGFSFHDGLTALELNLAAAEGALRLRLVGSDAVVATPYRRAELRLRADRRGFSGDAALELASGDGARARFNLPEWRPGEPFSADQPLRGAVQASLGELVWLSLLAPDVVATGRLHGRFALAGTLGRPLLDGQAALSGGQLAIPLLGISLTGLHLAVHPDGSDGLNIVAGARSGPGTLTVNGRAAPQGAGWGITMKVAGDNVEVARLPQAHIFASPDLRVSVADRTIHLQGLVVIPQARINLPELAPPVQSSSDVVVVDRGETEARQRPWTVISEVTLRFGDDVRLAGYGLAGRLAGELLVVEPAGGGALGRGELQILEGKYTSYGQDLTIEEGRLLYGNAPLNNPGIQFRAVRELEEVKVGVTVAGRLKKPEVRLYSEPAMDDTQILAWLVLGRPLETVTADETGMLQRAAVSLGLVGGTELARQIGDQAGLDVVNIQPVQTTTSAGSTATNGGTTTNGAATGAQPYQAALVLGKYLSPRLYVQYAVGLWDAGNTWEMRYLLNKNWTIKAESGLQSGLDLLYTIEK
jgi:translocation and assembly module TamB